MVKEAQGPCPGHEGGWGVGFGETHRATRKQGELGPDNCFWGLERGAALWTMGHGQRQANLPSHLSLRELGQVSGFPADYQRETPATHTFTHTYTQTYIHTRRKHQCLPMLTPQTCTGEGRCLNTPQHLQTSPPAGHRLSLCDMSSLESQKAPRITEEDVTTLASPAHANPDSLSTESS